ncbi:MAG: arylsulfatase, partial [Planctomycetes bacterium]|nr:arylsulfatase [Planctomycetota bacterium]
SAVWPPRRYRVLTGRYCWRSRLKHGVLGGFSLPLIDPARLTIASMLKQVGYATAAVGKWHVGLEWQSRPHRRGDPDDWDDQGLWDYTRPIIGGPRRLGFDYFFGIAGSLDMPPYCFIENERTVGIPSVEKSPYNPQQRQGLMVPGWRDEQVDSTFAAKAVAWLEETAGRRPERPFFLYLTPSAPHRPCMPPDWARGASRAGPRGDMVCVVDWLVGQVLDALERLGKADSTIVIVTSDNGARPCDVDGETYGHKSCGPLRGFKADIWDGGHREPFIVRWPGRVRAGSVSDQVICLGDLLATVAEIVGFELPENAAEDSFSFLPVLTGGEPTGPVRRAIIHHSLAGMFSIRRGRWKLIRGLGSGGFSEPRRLAPTPGGPHGQLYDMQDDLRETRNLWSDRQDIVEELTALLARAVETGRTR